MYNRSRDKGKRNEYLIRDYFRKIGYQAHRVPASGAAQGFPGDIMVTDPSGAHTLVEVKARKSEFDKIYVFVDTINLAKLPSYHFVGGGGKFVSISYDYLGLNPTSSQIAYAAPTNANLKDYGRIEKLHKYLGKANILVIKGDRKPPLFIRFQ